MSNYICQLSSSQLLVSAQASYSTDDLYLEGRPSGDIPVDDEDGREGGSGSGSGDYCKATVSLEGS